MVERKVFKTRLCVPYQRGRCSRPHCHFAHGDAELRGFSGSFRGRHDNGGRDVRDKDKSDGRRIPQSKCSPVRDENGRNTVFEHRFSRSLEREESGRRHRKKLRLDGKNDVSGSLSISSGTEETRDRNFTTDSRGVLVEQLKQVQLDISVLDHQKSQLEVNLAEKAQEADSLTSKIQELEDQLYKEKEENKRIVSKIKKFVKEHNYYSRIQDKLNRSQVRLHKLGDELASDINRTKANEEDSNVDIVSDGETGQNRVPSSKKRLEVSRGPKELEGADLGETHMDAPVRLKKDSQLDIPARSNYDEEIDLVDSRNGWSSLLANEGKHDKRKRDTILSSDKLKDLESGHASPSTSIAAQTDEDVEVELEDNIEVVATLPEKDDEIVGTASKEDNEKGATCQIAGFLSALPPPPPILKNNYSMYEGEDENIDVDLGEDEMVQVDVI
ncbi:hypothetical protein UlMin_022866 [Ulmus minor]